MTKKKRVVVIDGHAMAYRAHFALAPQGLVNSEGMPTGAVFGFFRMVVKLLIDFQPEYLIIIFDPRKKTFRSDIYKEYKQNRAKMPDELRFQLDEIQAIIKELHIPLFIPENEEADDAMASFAEINKNSNLEILLVSGDKDLFNVLYKNIKLLRAKKGVTEFNIIDAKYIKDELGLGIEQIPDFMALTGDTSDNVPGVKGIGEKTAGKLIIEHKNLENIYQNIDEIKPAGVQTKLRNSKDDAFLSKTLVTLKKDMQIPFEIKDLEWHKIPEMLSKAPIFKDKGYHTVFDEWVKLYETLGIDTKNMRSKKSVALLETVQIIRSKKDFEKIQVDLKQVKEISVDVETNGTSIVSSDLVGVSLAYLKAKKLYSAYIPAVFDKNNELNFDYQKTLSGKEAISLLKPVLENKGITKVGQNIKFDRAILARHGIEVKNLVHDTMVYSYILNPNRRRHGLDELSEAYLGHTTTTYKELTGTGKKQKALVSLPLEPLARYAAEDAEVTLMIKQILYDDLKKAKLEKLYTEIDLPLIDILEDLELNGISIDHAYLKQLSQAYEKRKLEYQTKIYELAGEEFNIQSTKELQIILFDKLGITPIKKTGKGSRSTDHSVLMALRNDHDIIENILEFRALSKLLSTYITTLPDYVNDKTKRIHTSFSQVTAATGRLASTEPNLQNIPIKGEDGKAIRKAFIAAEGCEFLSLDYSQIELRILAHYSEDKNLILAYQNNEDIHDQATYLLFKHQFDEKTLVFDDTKPLPEKMGRSIDFSILDKMKQASEFATKRSFAKILNFSIAYGVTGWGLSNQLSIPQKDSKQLIDLYFQSYPGIKAFMDSIKHSTRKLGYSENFFGRRRRIADINSNNRFTREAAERLAINTPIQSTAADIIKVAMINIRKLLIEKNLKTKMLLQIHDELLFEVPVEEKDSVFGLLKDQMEGVVELKVPLVVSGGFGPNWDEAK